MKFHSVLLTGLFVLLNSAPADAARALSVFTNWANSHTGEAFLNGGDSFDADRPPGWNGFEWDFGDGTTLTEGFPQFHFYVDPTHDYMASVSSQYSDFTTDTKSTLVHFPPAPTLEITDIGSTSISTNNGLVPLDIMGLGFQPGARVQFLNAGRQYLLEPSSLQFLGADHLLAQFDLTNASLGEWDLLVINPDLEAASFRTTFVIPEPSTCLLVSFVVLIISCRTAVWRWRG